MHYTHVHSHGYGPAVIQPRSFAQSPYLQFLTRHYLAIVVRGTAKPSFSQVRHVILRAAKPCLKRPLDGQYYCAVCCTIILLGVRRRCSIFAQ